MERGDWLLWYAARIGIDKKLIVSAACECARLNFGHLPEKENRPIKIIEAVEQWVQGQTDIQEIRDITEPLALIVEATKYDGPYAVHAIWAAAVYVARATYTENSDCASYSVSYAGSAIPTQRNKMLKVCADIVRKHIPVELIEQGYEKTKPP